MPEEFERQRTSLEIELERRALQLAQIELMVASGYLSWSEDGELIHTMGPLEVK